MNTFLPRRGMLKKTAALLHPFQCVNMQDVALHVCGVWFFKSSDEKL